MIKNGCRFENMKDGDLPEGFVKACIIYDDFTNRVIGYVFIDKLNRFFTEMNSIYTVLPVDNALTFLGWRTV